MSNTESVKVGKQNNLSHSSLHLKRKNNKWKRLFYFLKLEKLSCGFVGSLSLLTCWLLQNAAKSNWNEEEISWGCRGREGPSFHWEWTFDVCSNNFGAKRFKLWAFKNIVSWPTTLINLINFSFFSRFLFSFHLFSFSFFHFWLSSFPFSWIWEQYLWTKTNPLKKTSFLILIWRRRRSQSWWRIENRHPLYQMLELGVWTFSALWALLWLISNSCLKLALHFPLVCISSFSFCFKFHYQKSCKQFRGGDLLVAFKACSVGIVRLKITSTHRIDCLELI